MSAAMVCQSSVCHEPAVNYRLLLVENAVFYSLVPPKGHCQTHYPLVARGVCSAVSVDTVALKRAKRS